jgi:Ca2+-transporting ATPase
MKYQNKFLWGGAALSLLLTTAVLYVPFLQRAFSFEHISLFEYAIAMALAFMVIPVVELVKAIQRANARKKKG